MEGVDKACRLAAADERTAPRPLVLASRRTRNPFPHALHTQPASCLCAERACVMAAYRSRYPCMRPTNSSVLSLVTCEAVSEGRRG